MYVSFKIVCIIESNIRCFELELGVIGDIFREKGCRGVFIMSIGDMGVVRFIEKCAGEIVEGFVVVVKFRVMGVRFAYREYLDLDLDRVGVLVSESDGIGAGVAQSSSGVGAGVVQGSSMSSGAVASWDVSVSVLVVILLRLCIALQSLLSGRYRRASCSSVGFAFRSRGKTLSGLCCFGTKSALLSFSSSSSLSLRVVSLSLVSKTAFIAAVVVVGITFVIGLVFALLPWCW